MGGPVHVQHCCLSPVRTKTIPSCKRCNLFPISRASTEFCRTREELTRARFNPAMPSRACEALASLVCPRKAERETFAGSGSHGKHCWLESRPSAGITEALKTGSFCCINANRVLSYICANAHMPSSVGNGQQLLLHTR